MCEDITASDSYFKRFFPLLAPLLLALWPVAYAYAHTDDMLGPDAIMVEVAEASADSNVGTVSNATSGTSRSSHHTGAFSRLIVVDGNDKIVEMWSNTTGTRWVLYSLRVKEQPPQGPEHPLTQAILDQYNRLLGKVDWTQTGQVYSITTAE